MEQNELELKHIAPYLPYKLIIANRSLKGNIVSTYQMEIENTNDKGIANVLHGVNQIPVLHLLSSLTNPREINGKLILPIEYISTSKKDSERTLLRVAKNLPLDVLEYWKIERLLELHFDIFGLIDKNLAINFYLLNEHGNTN